MVLGANGQPAGPSNPIDFEGEFAVDAITIQLHDIELVGDTAPSGDLVFDSRALRLPTSTAEVSYLRAPSGLYSKLVFQVERAWADEELPDEFEGQRLSVRVVGSAHLDTGGSNMKDRKFDYSDDAAVEVDLTFTEDIDTPGMLIVELDVHSWFAAVDWEMLDTRGGGNQPMHIGMGKNDDVAAAMRDRLNESFDVRE